MEELPPSYESYVAGQRNNSRTISNREFPEDCPSVPTRDTGQRYGNHENQTESITCEVSTGQPRDSHSPCSDNNRLPSQVTTTRSVDNTGYHPHFINLQTNTSPTPETKTDTSVPGSTWSEISYTPRGNASHTERGGTVRFEPVYGETSEEISYDNTWDRKCLPYFVGFAFFLNVILGGIAIGLLLYKAVKLDDHPGKEREACVVSWLVVILSILACCSPLFIIGFFLGW